MDQWDITYQGLQDECCGMSRVGESLELREGVLRSWRSSSVAHGDRVRSLVASRPAKKSPLWSPLWTCGWTPLASRPGPSSGSHALPSLNLPITFLSSVDLILSWQHYTFKPYIGRWEIFLVSSLFLRVEGVRHEISFVLHFQTCKAFDHLCTFVFTIRIKSCSLHINSPMVVISCCALAQQRGVGLISPPSPSLQSVNRRCSPHSSSSINTTISRDSGAKNCRSRLIIHCIQWRLFDDRVSNATQRLKLGLQYSQT